MRKSREMDPTAKICGLRRIDNEGSIDVITFSFRARIYLFETGLRTTGCKCPCFAEGVVSKIATRTNVAKP